MAHLSWCVSTHMMGKSGELQTKRRQIKAVASSVLSIVRWTVEGVFGFRSNCGRSSECAPCAVPQPICADTFSTNSCRTGSSHWSPVQKPHCITDKEFSMLRGTWPETHLLNSD